jgi:DnaJ homolog subfamily B member 12
MSTSAKWWTAVVSRAFQILSDPDKKSKYDKFGGDPDNRFGAGSASTSSPFSNFARAASGGGRAGPMFEEEISPEEMFRQFFGGGMGGGFGPFGRLLAFPLMTQKAAMEGIKDDDRRDLHYSKITQANSLISGGGMFDTGPGFVFNLGGGPGIRVHQFGGGRPRRRPATATGDGQEAAPSLSSTLSSLLPLLILFVLPLLSSIFSGPSQPAGPSIRFQSVPPHTKLYTSGRLKIPYYVNPQEVEDLSARKRKQLDETAEVRYMHILHGECESEQLRQARLFQEAQGWFFTDENKLREARSMRLGSCEKLDAFQKR